MQNVDAAALPSLLLRLLRFVMAVVRLLPATLLLLHPPPPKPPPLLPATLACRVRLIEPVAIGFVFEFIELILTLFVVVDWDDDD